MRIFVFQSGTNSNGTTGKSGDGGETQAGGAARRESGRVPSDIRRQRKERQRKE